PASACRLDVVAPAAPELPRLLQAYVSLGARICGPPAIDREFKTIDFLTLLDLDSLRESAVRRWLGGEGPAA
ncbi:MAG: hemolysin, partial [Verrucomicrobiota bacterium]